MISERNIIDLFHARPFGPSEVHASDGRVYEVAHPDFLMRSREGNVVYYVTDDDRLVVIAASQIVALAVTNRGRAA